MLKDYIEQVVCLKCDNLYELHFKDGDLYNDEDCPECGACDYTYLDTIKITKFGNPEKEVEYDAY